ncbi:MULTISPECIES: GAF and ANTAR domain-containing protein [unclassified Frankia]|uniref:GAF and ANTAR domain-containing protein n=1 Tax=unclassified Frankia TaxID=2632575 RepID=UPI002AD56C46|nr:MULTISPECIES: GAF and ANTAR domain-containing protein [unclassified Frankia]
MPTAAAAERVGDPDRVRRTLHALVAGGSADGSAVKRLCAGAVSVLPVDGAAISLLTGLDELGSVVASDAATARLGDIQFTIGEGPCWDAIRDGRPVLVGDLTGSTGGRWPMFTAAALAADVRAVFAFPLQIGAIRLGTLGLVRAEPGGLGRGPLADALVVADIATLTLINLPADGAAGAADLPSEVCAMYRAEIHQATGMVMVQLEVSAQEALVRLRAHAFACGQTADEVARDIVARRQRLERDLP